MFKKLKRNDILELIENGEDIDIEFKLQFSSYEKIAKEIIAFANTRGGIMIIGIDDSKRIIGVESEKEETELIQTVADQYCEPPVLIIFDYMDIKGKEIVIVYVPESKTKPHRIQDYQNELDLNTAAVYVRVNDKSVPASKEMIRILRSQTSSKPLVKYSVGKVEKIIFEYLEKNEKITVKILSAIGNISYRRASRTLVNLVRADLLLLHTNDSGEDYFTNKM